MGEEIDMFVCDTPGVCDTNANAFSFASAYLDKPFFQLNYPHTIGDEKTKKYHLDDYLDLITFLEEQTGQKLDHEKLREILTEVDRQDELLAEIEDFHILVPNPIPVIYNLFIYIGRFLFSGHPEYTSLLTDILKAVEKKARLGKSGLYSGKENLRAYMCYIDHYTLDLNFFDWLDKRGIAHIGGILSKNFRDNAGYTADLQKST